MVVTDRNFEKLASMYCELIKQFLVLHHVIEVVCNDAEEHFFDRIVVQNNNALNVFKYGFNTPSFDTLLFDFTCDYAQCLAKMEHYLYLQKSRGKKDGDLYTFTFDESATD